MRTHVVWFSYAMDALPLQQSVRCAMATFPAGTGYWVFDDAANPLPAGAVQALCTAGATVQQTTFDRRGNLNGVSSMLGEIAAFRATGAAEDDVVWKCDSDTLVLRPDVFLRHYQNDANLLGCGVRCPGARSGWWGISYSYRAAVLDALQAGVKKMCPTCALCEDLAMSNWLLQQAPSRARTLYTADAGGTFMNYNWHTSLTLAEYARRFDIVSFGRRQQLAGTALQQRQQQAATMGVMLDDYLEGRS